MVCWIADWRSVARVVKGDGGRGVETEDRVVVVAQGGFLLTGGGAGFVLRDPDAVGMFIEVELSRQRSLQRCDVLLVQIFKRTPRGGVQNDDADRPLYAYNTHK